MPASSTFSLEGRNKAALLIALNYESPRRPGPGVGRLTSTHTDLDRLAQHLVDYWGYNPSCIIKMRDGDGDPDMRPTRKNIFREIANLVRDVRGSCGDRRVFYFAGHCFQVENHRGTENDDFDEVILVESDCGPLIISQDGGNRLSGISKFGGNMRRRIRDGIIIDNELRRHLVDRMPVGSKLVAISDTCNSGTLFDLDFHWQDDEFRSRMCTLVRPRILPNAWWKKGLSWGQVRSRLQAHCNGPSGVWRREEMISSVDHNGSMPAGMRSPRHGRRSRSIKVKQESDGINDRSCFADWPQCMSPPPGEVPDVVSVASSQDGEATHSGKESMTMALIGILEELGENRIMTCTLNRRLNVRMSDSRCNALEKLWKGSNRTQGFIQRGLIKVKRMQQPVIGSLSREAPSNYFEL
ncbi:caspase domain-containing protein [Irpex rosettiformis]|uniref:Caspase domain-containing protein n=1 Tax=Irpex rosettiformis TaxID=378272 RepID=A0ACB8U7G5_9APHY|nr:caspase domain-containing protein [Irpex rosettiformis]